MGKKIFNAKNAPEPIGPYNQAVKIPGLGYSLVYTSGQIPIDPKTAQLIEGDIKKQTALVLENLKNVLEGAGTSLDRVVKTTVFLKDMNHFADMNSVYSQYFQKETAPARSTIQVARLPKDALVEIEAVATDTY